MKKKNVGEKEKEQMKKESIINIQMIILEENANI